MPLNSVKHLDNASPRQSLRRLTEKLPPSIAEPIQQLFTEVVGKAYEGQQPPLRKSPVKSLIFTASYFGVGAYIGYLSLDSFIYALPVSSVMVVGAARTLLTEICHACVHGSFFGNRGDRWLCEIITTILFLQDYEGYRHDHVRCHHRASRFSRMDSGPDAMFLRELGFHPQLGVEVENNE